MQIYAHGFCVNQRLLHSWEMIDLLSCYRTESIVGVLQLRYQSSICHGSITEAMSVNCACILYTHKANENIFFYLNSLVRGYSTANTTLSVNWNDNAFQDERLVVQKWNDCKCSEKSHLLPCFVFFYFIY